VVSALTPAFEWRRLPALAQGELVSALALDARDGTLAVGDARGVRLLPAAGGFRRVLQRGPVRDLAFAPAGALLAATDTGLWRVDAEGRSQPLAAGLGEAERPATRLAVAGSLVAVATDGGAFVSADTLVWQRLSPALPAGPATAVAMRQLDRGHECFAVVDARLWRVWLESGGGVRAQRETLPFTLGDGGPVDVVFGVGGADVVVVYPDAFAFRAAGADVWEVARPALPPGASARRLAAAEGRLWLATDRGLLHAETLEGPWQRASAPAGTADVRSLASGGSALYAAAGDAVLVSWSAREAPSLAGVPRTPEGDPPIEHVHRAALHYLDLTTARSAELRDGVSRRGWLPIVALRGVSARARDDSVDSDESFVSGETHLLVDRQRDHARDFEASVTFSWDLGEILYHPEAVDVSREAREIIKLRDDVLDEVTQLYFERRRVLAELFGRPDLPAPERLGLQLRAAELAAGIDAWSGGWFTRARAAAGSP
jgi:hypothetical protein